MYKTGCQPKSAKIEIGIGFFSKILETSYKMFISQEIFEKNNISF